MAKEIDIESQVASMPDDHYESILKELVEKPSVCATARAPGDDASDRDRLVYELRKKADAERQLDDELFANTTYSNVMFDAKKLKKCTSHESYKPFESSKSSNFTSVHVDAAVKFPIFQGNVCSKNERSRSENEYLPCHRESDEQQLNTVVDDCSADQQFVSSYENSLFTTSQEARESPNLFDLIGDDFRTKFMSNGPKPGNFNEDDANAVEVASCEDLRQRATYMRNTCQGSNNANNKLLGTVETKKRSASQKGYDRETQSILKSPLLFSEVQSNRLLLPNQLPIRSYGALSPVSPDDPKRTGPGLLAHKNLKRNKRSDDCSSTIRSDEINGYRGADTLENILLYIEGNKNKFSNGNDGYSNVDSLTSEENCSINLKKGRGKKEVKKGKAKKASSIGTSCDACEVEEELVHNRASSTLDNMKFLCKSDEIATNFAADTSSASSAFKFLPLPAKSVNSTTLPARIPPRRAKMDSDIVFGKVPKTPPLSAHHSSSFDDNYAANVASDDFITVMSKRTKNTRKNPTAIGPNYSVGVKIYPTRYSNPHAQKRSVTPPPARHHQINPTTTLTSTSATSTSQSYRRRRRNSCDASPVDSSSTKSFLRGDDIIGDIKNDDVIGSKNYDVIASRKDDVALKKDDVVASRNDDVIGSKNDDAVRKSGDNAAAAVAAKSDDVIIAPKPDDVIIAVVLAHAAQKSPSLPVDEAVDVVVSNDVAANVGETPADAVASDGQKIGGDDDAVVSMADAAFETLGAEVGKSKTPDKPSYAKIASAPRRPRTPNRMSWSSRTDTTSKQRQSSSLNPSRSTSPNSTNPSSNPNASSSSSASCCNYPMSFHASTLAPPTEQSNRDAGRRKRVASPTPLFDDMPPLTTEPKSGGSANLSLRPRPPTDSATPFSDDSSATALTPDVRLTLPPSVSHTSYANVAAQSATSSSKVSPRNAVASAKPDDGDTARRAVGLDGGGVETGRPTNRISATDARNLASPTLNPRKTAIVKTKDAPLLNVSPKTEDITAQTLHKYPNYNEKNDTAVVTVQNNSTFSTGVVKNAQFIPDSEQKTHVDENDDKAIDEHGNILSVDKPRNVDPNLANQISGENTFEGDPSPPQRRFSCPPVEFLDKKHDSAPLSGPFLHEVTFGCFDDDAGGSGQRVASESSTPRQRTAAAIRSKADSSVQISASNQRSTFENSSDVPKPSTANDVFFAASDSSATEVVAEFSRRSAEPAPSRELSTNRTVRRSDDVTTNDVGDEMMDACNETKPPICVSGQTTAKDGSANDPALHQMADFLAENWKDFTSGSKDVVWYGK